VSPAVTLADSTPALDLMWVGAGFSAGISESTTHLVAVKLSGPPAVPGSSRALSVDTSLTIVTGGGVPGFEAKIDPPVLFFTAEDWSVPHTLTLDVSDDEVAPSPLARIRITLAGSTAADAAILSGPLVDERDVGNNDVPGIETVRPLATSNEPPRHSNYPATIFINYLPFKVRLTSRPTQPVTVMLKQQNYPDGLPFAVQTHRTYQSATPLVIQPDDYFKAHDPHDADSGNQVMVTSLRWTFSS
jgi:hypothetical protein